jgi:tRNA(Ile)-lysidine synthase
MTLLQKFQTHWQQNFAQLSPANCHLMLAVSGGVDSVVLVDLVHKAGFPFTIAHANFQLRKEESTRDEEFVRSLGDKYNREVLVRHFDTQQYATDQKISIQEAARDLRYGWFAELVLRYQKDTKQSAWILTAHHADDNIETLLMHFFRGTGINGLTGIPSIQKERSLVRPLLGFRKQELLQYANDNGLPFVEDSSNASDKYTRNFFRNTLLPQIREVFPQAEENLLHNIERFSGTAILYRQSVEQHLKKLVEHKNNEWHIPVLKWKKTEPLHSISWELIRPYGFTAAQTDEVIRLLDAENSSYISSPTHRIIKNRNWMIISPLEENIAQHILIEEDEKMVGFEHGSLQLQHISGAGEISNSLTEAFLDRKEISFPLLLRRWKQGDYFYPLGMQKKKKLSRFFIDQKLSRTEKEKAWVLESDKKIVWIVGYRIDNRYRITGKTKDILHLSYLPMPLKK